MTSALADFGSTSGAIPGVCPVPGRGLLPADALPLPFERSVLSSKSDEDALIDLCLSTGMLLVTAAREPRVLGGDAEGAMLVFGEALYRWDDTSIGRGAGAGVGAGGFGVPGRDDEDEEQGGSEDPSVSGGGQGHGHGEGEGEGEGEDLFGVYEGDDLAEWKDLRRGMAAAASAGLSMARREAVHADS